MNEAASVHADRPFRALLYRLAAMAVLSSVLVLAKLAHRSGLSISVFIFWRQLVPVVLILAWFGSRGQLHRLRTTRIKVHISRSVTGLVGIYLVTGGAQALPLAESTVFGFTSPIFAVILAATWLREMVGWVRWSAVVVGLLGVAAMAGPGSGQLPIFGIGLAVGGALLVAITSIQLRELGRTEDPLTTIFWYFLICSLSLAGPVLATSTAMTAEQWMILLAAGPFALFGQLFLTSSLRFGHVSSVIIMDYTSLGWALLWGWLVFGDFPPAQTWLGAPIIICSGAIIVLRERHLALRAARKATAEAVSNPSAILQGTPGS